MTTQGAVDALMATNDGRASDTDVESKRWQANQTVTGAAASLSALVLSRKRSVKLTREQLMLWIAQDGATVAVLDRIVALFSADEG